MILSDVLLHIAADMRDTLDAENFVFLDACQARDMVSVLAGAAVQARSLESVAGPRGALLDVIAFAKSGEPRPSAEVLDLSEILGREQVSRHASEAGPELAEIAKNSGSARLYAFPTVRPVSFDFSKLDGGGAA